MSQTNNYVPPAVWTWDAENGGNGLRPTGPVAGATHEAVLPRGKHPLQLYSMGTPNGQKVTILLEELLALGERRRIRCPPDPHRSGASSFDRFRRAQSELQDSGAVRYRDRQSGLRKRRDSPYLAGEVRAFSPRSAAARTEVLELAVLAAGLGPSHGGGFGHFYAYAPEKFEYPDQPLHHGGEAPDGRTRPRVGRASLSGRTRIFHRRYRHMALVRQPGAGVKPMARASSCRSKATPTRNAGRRISSPARRCSAAVKVNRAQGEASAQLRMSATMHRTSNSRPRTK